MSDSYLERRGEIETYFDRTAATAWQKLTSDAPVSGIRATVRAGRDRMRATLLSIQSLLAMVFLIPTEPALGLVADRFGVHTAYLVMAGLLALFCFPLLWKGRAALDG